MKRAVSIILTLILVFGTVSVCAVNVNADELSMPVIYVHGYGATLMMKQDDGTEKKVYPAINTDDLLAQLGEQKSMIAEAFITQDWSEFDDFIVDYVADAYRDMLCDSDGNSVNDVYADVHYTDDYMNQRSSSYKDNVETFSYEYDFRLDPYDQMEKLRDYVERVQNVTGSREYCMVGRCLGANLVLTYMEKYKDPDLKKVCFYIPSFKGASPVSESFSGDLSVTAEGIERLLYETDLNVNYEVGDLLTIDDVLIREIATVAVDTYGLDYAAWAINNVYENIYTDIIPRMMLSAWGTYPGYWSMVNDDIYAKAKELIFGGAEDEYSGLIKKIDYYHYTIMNRAEDIISEAEERGTYVADIVKYDVSGLPLGSRQNELSDYTVFVTDGSLGATCADTGETLDDDYLTEAAMAGNKYISPDKKIDASTCFRPDTTWFVKNSKHADVQSDFNRLMTAIFVNDDFTVFDDESFPQYMYYDDETQTISPLLEEGSQQSIVDNWVEATESPLREMKPFTNWIFRLLTLISKLLLLPARYH